MKLSKQIVLFVGLFLGLLAVLVVIQISIHSYADRGIAYHIEIYETTGNANGLKAFVTEYHGEAENHEVTIGFINWGIRNPNHFVKVTALFSESESEMIASRLAFALSDTGSEKRLDEAFGGTESTFIRNIRSKLQLTNQN